MAIKGRPLKNIGTGLSAGAQIFGGYAADDVGQSMGAQLRERANTRRAVAQREAARERHMGKLVESRAVAVMLANGGTSDDVGAVMQLSKINAESEYRAMSHLWTGDDEADGMREIVQIC